MYQLASKARIKKHSFIFKYVTISDFVIFPELATKWVIPRGFDGIKIRKRGLGKERKMTYKLGKEKECGKVVKLSLGVPEVDAYI